MEVQIDKDYTMLVDFDDCFRTVKTKGGKATAQYYAAVTFKGTREDKKNGKKMIPQVTGNEPHQPEHHGQPNQKSEQQQQTLCLFRNEGMFLGFLGKTSTGYRTRAWSSSRSGSPGWCLASADQTRQQRTYRGVQFTRRVVWQWKHARTFQNNSIV